MNGFLTKLKSRKLWLALIGAASGVAIAFGADNSIVQEIAGAATALVSVVAYIVTEGKIDAASVKLSADFVNELLEAIDYIRDRKEDEGEE